MTATSTSRTSRIDPSTAVIHGPRKGDRQNSGGRRRVTSPAPGPRTSARRARTSPRGARPAARAGRSTERAPTVAQPNHGLIAPIGLQPHAQAAQRLLGRGRLDEHAPARARRARAPARAARRDRRRCRRCRRAAARSATRPARGTSANTERRIASAPRARASRTATGERSSPSASWPAPTSAARWRPGPQPMSSTGPIACARTARSTASTGASQRPDGQARDPPVGDPDAGRVAASPAAALASRRP